MAWPVANMKTARQALVFMILRGDLTTVIISPGTKPFAPILTLCRTIPQRLLICLAIGMQSFAPILTP